ncbi:MAG TPA: protein translocase subunit SecD [Chitinivibrionales bacterium]|nr:protein translocase subunit SecD [Chitinivibrionales bacterium]
MNRNITIGMIVTVALIGLALFFLKDSILFYTKSPQEQDKYAQSHPTVFKKIINLGLDIQGGMRIVLEIDKSNLPKEATGDILDRAYTVIENRINGLGVAEPSIQKQGTERIIVELPGFRDEAAASRVIGSTAQLEFNLLREPAELDKAIKVIDNTLKGQKPADTGAAAASADTLTTKKKEAQSKAQSLFEGKELHKDTAAAAAESTQTEDTTTAASFSELLSGVGEQIGVLESNKAKVDAILARKDVKDALERSGLGGSNFLWGHETRVLGSSLYRMLYYVKSRPEMRGDAIRDARGSIDRSGFSAGQAIVELEMNNKGAKTFSRVTGANVNKYLAIVLDSTVYSAPVIRSKIPSGRAQIEGSFTMEEAKNLAVVLRAGALPAPVKIMEQRTVGPSLGQDSIRDATYAAIIGAVLVFIFILFYYKLSGAYAVFALILNLLFVLAAMATINATLTIPGICGLVLNLAVAVDANVLICERIREELHLGKTVRSAIDIGYKRVLVVILDSNLTMLIKAAILLWIGTGAIKGFAVTLMFGLIISMFTSLYITHIMYNIFTPKTGEKLSI